MQTTTIAGATPALDPTDPGSLDDLAQLDLSALDALYRRGGVPAALGSLDGEPRCRMLAVRGLDHGQALRVVRDLARARFFPWRGKSFRSTDDPGHGEGINRVRLAGRRRWFPFRTRIEPSDVDGAPCILLDYDLPANPAPIRRLRDELREIAPGLFLGPARIAGRTVLYFACDTRQGRPPTSRRAGAGAS
jgi:hypothetical protein